MGQRILAICDSDGNRFNLLSEIGISVKEWRPKRPDVNASFREVPGIDGRLPSSWKFNQVTETFEHNAKAQTADDLIELFQDMYRLLILGLNYHTVNWQATRVWLECKAEQETNTRYALISLFQPGDDDFPFRDPFLPIGGISPSATDTGLIIERGHWLALPPGEGECVEIGNVQSWESVDMGVEEDCDGKIRLSNKLAFRNLTHIKIFDASGSSYTDIFPITSFPQNIFPDPLATNDITYFGIEESSFSPTFNSLVFDIDVNASLQSVAWEYWSGSWSALTFSGDFGAFGIDGVNSIFWEIPDDWAKTTVDGVTGYWVRARITTATAVNSPNQINRQIYTAVHPYFETSDVLGDISALARFKATNRAARFTGTDLHVNRVVCGLRSTSRGEAFRSYLNAANAADGHFQVSLGTDTTSEDSVYAPTGFVARYEGNTLDSSPITRVTFSFTDIFPSGFSTDFYGTYHAYLRMWQVDGGAGDIRFRLKTITGSGGVSFYSNIAIPQTNDNFEVLDFGQISIGGGVINPDEHSDALKIEVQLANLADDTRTVDIYDLIIIPTDEWFGDFTDQINNEFSTVGGVNTNDRKLIDIDSISNPKKVGRSVVRFLDTDYICSTYEFAANGEVMLQANATQRLWVFAMAYNDDGYWIARPEVGWSVQAYKNQRYLAARGSR